eukprot:PhM_4_TR9261/c0_g2_i1/m.75845
MKFKSIIFFVCLITTGLVLVHLLTASSSTSNDIVMVPISSSSSVGKVLSATSPLLPSTSTSSGKRICTDHKPVLVFPVADGARFFLWTKGQDVIIRQLRAYSVWEREKSKQVLSALFDVVHHFKRQPVFYDVGANIGYFSVLAASHGAKTYAFEPMKQNYEMINCTLQHDREDDGVLTSNLELFPAALDVKNSSTCAVYSDDGNSNDGHLVCDVETVRQAEPHFFNLYKLRSYITTLRLDSLSTIRIADVVKIDVEGHELAAFDGMVSMIDRYPERFVVIFSEFSPWMMRRKGFDPKQFLDMFTRRGYEMFDGNKAKANSISEYEFFTPNIAELDYPLDHQGVSYDLVFVRSSFMVHRLVKESSQLLYTPNSVGVKMLELARNLNLTTK